MSNQNNRYPILKSPRSNSYQIMTLSPFKKLKQGWAGIKKGLKTD